MSIKACVPAFIGALAAVAPAPTRAQAPVLTPKAVAEISDAVLDVVVHPDSLVSRVAVSKRKVYFDHARTLAAFRIATSPEGVAPELKLRAPVRSGSRRLLDDCDQTGRKPCKQLGWSAYAWIEPIAVSPSEARVRAWVQWPDRGRAPYLEGVSPSGRAELVGFGMEVFLVRAQNGTWRYARVGSALVQ